MSKPATRSDWKTRPMPRKRAALSVELAFDDAEFERLIAGLVPREMEDKWFIFFERPWLYLHRSWTGFCIFQIRFVSDAGRHCAAEAVVNRDSKQYGELSAAEDILMLKRLLCDVIERDSE